MSDFSARALEKLLGDKLELIKKKFERPVENCKEIAQKFNEI